MAFALDFYSQFKEDEYILSLKKKTGYNVVRIYGQRIMGPPPFWSGPPPPRGCEVYIGKLPKYVMEDELFPLFATAGLIYEFRLLVEHSKSNKGYAYAMYTNKVDAERAIALLNGYTIRPGYIISVLKSVEHNRLLIKGLPTSVGKAEIFNEIATYSPGVVDVVIHGCPDNAKNPGFAFIEYESHRAASRARKILIPAEIKLFNCEIEYDWAPEPEFDPETMKWVSALFVRSLPQRITESQLQHIFSMQGSLPVHQIKKRNHSAALIHYFSVQDAEVAFHCLNGLLLCGSHIDIKWAKPPRASKVPQTLNTSNSSVQRNANISNGFDYGSKQSELKQNFLGYNPVQTYFPNLPHPVKTFPSDPFVTPPDTQNSLAEFGSRYPACVSNYPPIYDGSMPTYPPQSSWPPKNAHMNDQSPWNTVLDYQPAGKSEFQQQDGFLNLMASAASMASIHLQSKEEPNQML